MEARKNFHHLLSRRNTVPVRKYEGTFFDRVYQAALMLPATKHEPSAASVIDRMGVSPAGVC